MQKMRIASSTYSDPARVSHPRREGKETSGGVSVGWRRVAACKGQ